MAKGMAAPWEGKAKPWECRSVGNASLLFGDVFFRAAHCDALGKPVVTFYLCVSSRRLRDSIVPHPVSHTGGRHREPELRGAAPRVSSISMASNTHASWRAAPRPCWRWSRQRWSRLRCQRRRTGESVAGKGAHPFDACALARWFGGTHGAGRSRIGPKGMTDCTRHTKR